MLNIESEVIDQGNLLAEIPIFCLKIQKCIFSHINSILPSNIRLAQCWPDHCVTWPMYDKPFSHTSTINLYRSYYKSRLQTLLWLRYF